MFNNTLQRLFFLFCLMFGSTYVFCQELSFDKKTKDEILKYEKLNDGVLTDSIGSFGKPSRSETIANNSNSLVKNIFWEDNVKIIRLSMRFDRKLQELPGLSIISDFHITAMVTFK